MALISSLWIVSSWHLALLDIILCMFVHLCSPVECKPFEGSDFVRLIVISTISEWGLTISKCSISIVK